VFRDLVEDKLFVEQLIVDSWGGYVRSWARSTVADRSLLQGVERLQKGNVPVRVSMLIGIDRASAAFGSEVRAGWPRAVLKPASLPSCAKHLAALTGCTGVPQLLRLTQCKGCRIGIAPVPHDR
jgi:hypothetical protein